MGRFDRFSNYLVKTEDGLALTAAGVIAFMMIYTTVGVVARRAGSPIKGTTEYVCLILVWVVMFAIPYAQRRWRHLSMGIVFDRLAPGHQRPVLCVLLSLGIFICVMLTWSSLDTTIWAYVMGDEYLGAIPVKTWWSRMALPIGLGAATMRLTVQLVQVVRGKMEI